MKLLDPKVSSRVKLLLIMSSVTHLRSSVCINWFSKSKFLELFLLKSTLKSPQLLYHAHNHILMKIFVTEHHHKCHSWYLSYHHWACKH